MPPKQKITKEALLSHALEIAREHGIAAVTSRSVAQSAGCSIQPVFSHFPTMEALRNATFEYACNKSTEEILAFQNEPDFLTRTNIWLLNLARTEPKLFELLYMSDSFRSPNLWDTMMEWECNQRTLAAFQTFHHMTEAESKDIFLRCFFMLFGIAAMIATDKIDISNEEAIDMVKRSAAQMAASKKG